MDLIVLGSNGPYPSPYGATAGYLALTSGGYFALDMGSGVFSRLSKLTAPEKIRGIVLSHLHYDHICDLGVFNYYLEYLTKNRRFKGKVPVYLPAEAEPQEVVDLRIRYPYFDFVPVVTGKKYELSGVTFEFEKLRHSAVNYGVRVTDGKSRLVYSGDTNVCAGLKKLLSACDLWLCGAPFLGDEYKEKGYHLGVEIAEELAEEHDVRTVISHLVPVHTVKEYRAACYSAYVEIAEAFKTYHL